MYITAHFHDNFSKTRDIVPISQCRKLNLKVIKAQCQHRPLISCRPGVHPTAGCLTPEMTKTSHQLSFGKRVGMLKHYFVWTRTGSIYGKVIFRDHHPPHFPLAHLLSPPDPWRHWVCDPCFQHCPPFSTRGCHLLGVLVLCTYCKEGTCWRWSHDVSQRPVLHEYTGKNSPPPPTLTMRAQLVIIHLWTALSLASMYSYTITLMSGLRCSGKPFYSHIKEWKMDPTVDSGPYIG